MSSSSTYLPRPRLSGRKPIRGSSIVITIILIILGLTVVVPLLLPWFFVFKTQLEYARNPWAIPVQLRMVNFVQAWQTIRIDQGLLNTILVCAGAVLCTVPASALSGYIFARYRSRTTEIVFYLVMVGYFVPFQMVLIPLLTMGIKIGIANTLPGVFLPMAAFGIPFWCLIYRAFFRGLPGELADAAMIDGAGHSATFFRIMLPLAAPASALAILLVFIGAWSDYFLSLVMLNDQNLFTMQLRVAQFLGTYGVDRMPRYAAAAIIAAAPTIILYIIFNRWIIRGTLAGALKG